MARFKEGEYVIDHGGYLVKIIKVDEAFGTYTMEYDDPTCEWDGKQKTHPIARCDKGFQGQSNPADTLAPSLIKKDGLEAIIVDERFEMGKETPFGTRWGGHAITLSKEHIKALNAGQYVAIDVESEYVAFLKAEEPQKTITSTDADYMHNLELKFSLPEKLTIAALAIGLAYALVMAANYYMTHY